MILPIVGQALVEIRVLIFGDLFCFFHPNGLVLVKLFKFSWNFLYFLFLLFFIVLFDLNIFSFFFLFIFIIRNLFFCGLFNLKRNFERDKLRMLFNQVLNFSLFDEFDIIRFKGKDNFWSSSNSRSVIFNNWKCSSCSWLPSPLLLIFSRFGNDCNFIGN